MSRNLPTGETVASDEAVHALAPETAAAPVRSRRPPRGLRWLRVALPLAAAGALVAVVVGGNGFRLEGSPPDGAVTTGEPILDVTAEEFSARVAVESLIDAFVADEPLLAGDLLDTSPDTSHGLALPGMGGRTFDVWDAAGAVDQGALAGATSYYSALDTNIVLRHCHETVLSRADVRFRVGCEYDATSALLSSLGIGSARGAVNAVTHLRRVESMILYAEQEQDAWSMLERIASAFYPELTGTRTSGEVDWLGLDNASEDLAAEHMAIADLSGEYVLSPGDVRTAEGPLGLLEFSFLDEPFGPDARSVSAPVWTGDRFVVAVMHGESEAWALPTLWESDDGLTWARMASQPEVGSIYEMLPFGSRLLVAGYQNGNIVLLASDGPGWREVALSLPEGPELDTEILSLAATDEVALVIVEATDWTPYTRSRLVFLVGGDLTARTVDLPVDPEGSMVYGDSDGLVFISLYGDMWLSETGESWTSLAGRTLDLYGPPQDIARRDGTLFLLGYDDPSACTGATLDCIPPPAIARSTDGISWEVVSIPIGMTDAEAIDAGEFALVADVRAPVRMLWLSPDGTTWGIPHGIALAAAPDDDQWPSGGVAIGDAALVVSLPDAQVAEGPASVVVARLLER